MKCPKCGYEIDTIQEMEIKFKEANESYIENIEKYTTKEATDKLSLLSQWYNCLEWIKHLDGVNE